MVGVGLPLASQYSTRWPPYCVSTSSGTGLSLSKYSSEPGINTMLTVHSRIYFNSILWKNVINSNLKTFQRWNNALALSLSKCQFPNYSTRVFMTRCNVFMCNKVLALEISFVVRILEYSQTPPLGCSQFIYLAPCLDDNQVDFTLILSL